MTDVKKGLSTKQAEKLTLEGKVNVSVGKQSKTIGQIIAGNVFTYFNLIFAVFAVLLALVRSYNNMTFVPVIIFNMLIGIIQEIRAKKVLDKLTVVNAPKTSVIRDGQLHIIDSETLVKGDLCVFSAGNQLSADAILVEGFVRVNESLVTGESDEVVKNAGDILLSGSFIVSGECKAVLTNVGLDAYAAKLAIEAKAGRKKQKTDMMESLDKLVKTIGVLIIPIGIGLFLQSRFAVGSTIKGSIDSMVASLVGMIPEGLYLLASVALVVSVMRLGKKNVLVHEMNCVETLARVNVLCVDKTGTITKPDMSVTHVEILDYTADSGEAVDSHGVDRIIKNVVGAIGSDNATMEAIHKYYGVNEEKECDQVFPFSSQNKYSGARYGKDVYLLGAPEYLLLEAYPDYKKIIDKYSGNGERIVVFGKANEEITGEAVTRAITPMAFIILENEIRETAKDTFDYFKQQGVAIKVISGDNPVTASRVAIKAGIENATHYVDATTLKTDDDITQAVEKYTVFGRVIPEQKKKIIEAFKVAGNVVAMTGDGVNDVLALKCADCSVAMASGSEAASNAAQIVLLDSDFSKMPHVVGEGRRVVNNIKRSASLFLAKNIFSMLLTIFTLISVNLYPLYPTQLSFLGVFTIGIPAFFLALQPNKSLIKGDFLLNVVLKALPTGLTDFIVVTLITIYGNCTGLAHEQTATAATLVLLTVGMAALIRVCMPFDMIRVIVCIAMAGGIVFSMIFLRPLFAMVVLKGLTRNLTIIMMILSIPLYRYVCRMTAWLIDFLENHNRHFRHLLKG
ncbi:MAG: HAD-IC family P-type ATPase [Lachnospira sp.]|nr:HAD-IC family P-type ATPase [Lachnospira sp.]